MLLNFTHEAVLHITRDVSYRIVLIFSLVLLWLCSDGGRLGLVPGNLQHAAFKLSSLVGCLENKNNRAVQSDAQLVLILYH